MSNKNVERVLWILLAVLALVAGSLLGRYSIEKDYETAWAEWKNVADGIVSQPPNTLTALQSTQPVNLYAGMPKEVFSVNHVQNTVQHLSSDNPDASLVSAYPIEIFRGIGGNTHLRIKLCAEYAGVPSLNQCVESMVGSGDYWYKWYNLSYPPMPPVYK